MLYIADFILHMPFELYHGTKAAQQEDEQGGRGLHHLTAAE